MLKDKTQNNANNVFYVYEWYNVDTNIVFYVGKGSKGRLNQIRGRNEYFQRYYEKHNCKVRKTKINLPEDIAYEEEIKLIEKHRLSGQCMCNFKDGGQGGASYNNCSDDTNLLKLIASYINNSTKLIGQYSNIIFLKLGSIHEISLVHAFQEFGLGTSEEYYALDREAKLMVARKMTEIIEEYEYDDEVRDLVEEGACGSFDEYWEHVYKF